MVGFGTEYALGNNWSVKAEYDYMNFGSRTPGLTGTDTTGGVTSPIAVDAQIDQAAIHVAKVGVNYRFGGLQIDPTFAPYRRRRATIGRAPISVRKVDMALTTRSGPTSLGSPRLPESSTPTGGLPAAPRASTRRPARSYWASKASGCGLASREARLSRRISAGQVLRRTAWRAKSIGLRSQVRVLVSWWAIGCLFTPRVASRSPTKNTRIT
jgi:hypothetical protein